MAQPAVFIGVISHHLGLTSPRRLRRLLRFLPRPPPSCVLVSSVIAPDPAAWAELPPAPLHMADPNREGYVVFTSGSSGQPEAVSHAHRAILARAAMHQGWEGLTPDDRLLHAGALNWTYTLGTGLLDPWTCGATALIPAAGTPPSALPALMARSKATILAAAPGVFRQMLRAPFPGLPHLRHALSAGEGLPDGCLTVAV